MIAILKIMQRENLSQRIAWIDVAKAILIFFVVLCHTLRIGYLDVYATGFVVPCFFIISGIIFKEKSNISCITSLAKRVLVPYYIFGLISVLIYCFIGEQESVVLNADISNFGLLSNIYGLIYSNCKNGFMQWNTPLYFLPVYFLTLCIVNIFENCISKRKNRNIYRYISLVVGLVISYVVTKFNTICLPFSAESIPYSFFFVELGIVLRNVILKEYNKIIILLVAIVTFATGYYLSSINLPYGLHLYLLGENYFLFTFTELLFCCSIILFAKVINSCNIMSIIGRNTIGILCMHKFPVLFFVTYISPLNRIIVNPNESILMNVTGICISLVAIALCLLCTYVIMLICPWILGENKRNNIFLRGNNGKQEK